MEDNPNGNINAELYLPFSGFKINVTKMNAFSDMFPGKELILEKNFSNKLVREHSSMKNNDNSSFQLENYSLEIGKIFSSEFPYMWLKEVKGKKPIDLYTNFMPSI